MTVDKVLENCRVVTSTEILDANIAIDDGKIVKIARSPQMPDADAKVDVNGRIVIPGVIDTHVHFRDPGFTHKEDFETGSMAAAFGGVTAVFDMPNTRPRTDSEVNYHDKLKIAKKMSYVDYGIYLEITDGNLKELSKVEPIGYKAYLDSDRVSYDGLQKALSELRGAVVSVHGEEYGMIKNGKYSAPESHSDVRSELGAIKNVLGMDFGTNLMKFCHVSTEAGLMRVAKAGMISEVTPHHLLLDLGAYDKLGAFAKVNPSLKSKDNVRGLWSLIDKVDMIGSDHAPHTSEEKSKNIEDAASGFPGVETLLPLMVDCVNKEMLTWNELVRLTSYRPAEVFGLKDKGRIEVGADADLVVIDRKRERVIQAETLHSKCGWTPYENWTVKCEISKVFLRGEQIIDGQGMLTIPGFGEQVG